LLIIFDLDDTLIDTSGSILPHRHRSALSAMMNQGFTVDCVSSALKELKELDKKSLNSKITLESFLGMQQDFLEIGLNEIYGNQNFSFPVAFTDGAIEAVDALAEEHTLAIVTYGDPDVQEKKMEKAGLDKALFSTIVVCREPNKGPHYKTIFEKYGEDPLDVVVCGDRIERDLLPAKELGFNTVLMRWGRGKTQEFDSTVIDREINSLRELLQINN
jgi:putative hydrolase of the HAD superfamily